MGRGRNKTRGLSSSWGWGGPARFTELMGQHFQSHTVGSVSRVIGDGAE